MTKKWVLFILILLVAIAISAQAMLQSQFYSKKIKHFVESHLEDVVGEGVSVGTATINLFSASLILEGVAFTPPGTLQPALFTADRIEVQVSPGSIFTEIFLVRRIEIEKPAVQLSAETLGQNAALKDTFSMKNAVTDNPPPVVIQEVIIRDGGFRFNGEVLDRDLLRLSGISVEIKPDLKMRRFELQFGIQKGRVTTDMIDRELNDLEGEAFVHDKAVEIKKIFVSSGKATLLSDGTYNFNDESPLDLHLDLNVPLEDIPLSGLGQNVRDILERKEITGQVGFIGRLMGSAENVALAGKLSVPKVNIQGEKAVSVQGAFSYRDRQVDFSEVSGTLFTGEFSGNFKAVWPHISEGEDTLKKDVGLDLAFQFKNIPVDKAVVFVPDVAENETMLTKGLFVSGDLALSRAEKESDFEGAGTLRLVRLPLFSPPVQKTSEVLQKVTALLESGEVDWTLSPNGVTHIKEGRLAFPETDASFQGQWSKETGLRLDTTLNSLELEKITNTFDLPLTGKLNANGVLTFQEKQPSFEGGFLLEYGNLRGQAFTSLISEIQFRNQRLSVSRAVLTVPSKKIEQSPESPEGVYTAKGELDFSVQPRPGFDFTVNVRSGNPQEVFRFLDLDIPLYSTVNGAVTVRGNPDVFVVKGPFQLGKGMLYGEHFEKGQVDLTVSEKEVVLENAALSHEKSLMTGRGTIGYDETFRMTLKGEHLRVQKTALLNWMPPTLRAEIGLVVTGEGDFNHPRIVFTAAVDDFQYSGFSAKRGRIKAEWQNNDIFFDAQFPDEELALSGEVKVTPTYPYSFSGTFNRFPVDPLLKDKTSGPVADVKVVASGKLSGSGEIVNPARINLSGTLTEVLADFGTYQLQNDGPLPIHATEGAFVFDGVRLKGENTALVVNGGFKFLEKWGLFFKGETDLNLITFFSKKIATAQGKAVMDLSISDVWTQPRLRGELSLKNGKIRAVRFSQSLEITSLSAVFNEQQVVLDHLQGKLGGGDFHAAGKASISGFGVGDFGFLLELKKVRLDLTEGLPAMVRGELFFQKEGVEQTLKGELTVRNMTYEKKIDLKNMMAEFLKKRGNTLSEETPVLGRTKINIHLYGKENIWISNNLAKLPLVIDLFVKGSFDRPQLLGRIDVPDGEIYFRNNTFKVASGSVNFLSLEEINPSFELNARTDVRNIVTERNYTIDLSMTGTLSQITLTWNSFPSLPEADILALLAVGKTTADFAREGLDAGTEATHFVVTELFADPVEQVTEIVGTPVERLTGIDQIRVEPSIDGSDANATVGTRVTAEKKLMEDRLVVIYTTTLDPSEEEVIRMVYEVSKNISLVGKRDKDGQIGGDIRFRFEFR